MARESTTVLIFEDLQWADPGQLDFIDHLMEWAKGVPLLVVTLARPDLLERRPGWGTSARSFNAIGLEPLTDDQMRQLLLGLVPSLPAGTVEQILARADGIPLYVVETVRMLITDGRLVPDGAGAYRPGGELGELAIPDTLRALVASRLDGLDPDDRALLQDATVLGQTFDHRSLAHINGRDEDVVEARLRALVKRELLELSVDPRSPERGQYGFVQSVIREVAYDTLSRRDRRSRHLAAARYYEAEGDEELAAVLATHYLAALQASDDGPEAEALRVQARLALRGAADRAIDLGSPDQALTHLESAITITTEPAERGPLLTRASEAAASAAALTKGTEYGHQAMAAFEAAGDQRSRLRAAGTLGSALLDNDQLEDAVELLERSAEEAEPYPEIRADLLARSARAYMRLTRDEEAVEAADRAIVIAEPLRLDRITAEAFVNKGSALMKLGRLREPTIFLRAGAELAHEVGDYDLELRARSNLSVFLSMQDLTTAIALRSEAIQLAQRLGSYKYAMVLRSLDAGMQGEAGLDWEAAIKETDLLLGETDEPVARAGLLGGKLWYQVRRDEPWQETWAELESMRSDLGDSQDVAYGLNMRALALLYAGRSDEALQAVQEAIPNLGQLRELGHWHLVLIGYARRDVGLVREGVEQLHAAAHISNAYVATRAFAAALAAVLEGRETEARDLFHRAVDTYRLAGWLYDVAQAQTMALEALPGEPSFAGWAEEAQSRLEHLRAIHDLRRLEAALASSTAVGAAGTS
jgi:tetratricopeptide (TPR) repeat protein